MAQTIQVIDPNGMRGTARLDDRDSEGRLLVNVEGRTLAVPLADLTAREDGVYVVGYSLSQGRTPLGSADDVVVIPVTEETFTIERHEVETGRVRLTKHVSERTVTVEEPVMRDDVDIERVMVNRYVETPAEVRYEGDTLIVPLMEEVVVVEKRLMLREELHINRRRHEVSEAQEVVLRREEVSIDRAEASTDTLD